MAMTQNDIAVVGGTQIQVGTSQVIRVTPSANQVSTLVRYGSGGSLELVPIQFSGTSTGSGGSNITWTKGFSVDTVGVAMTGNAVFYLAANGSTGIAQLLCGYSAGASTP